MSKQLTRIPFAHLPTRVESLPRLSDALGGPQILVKRDDQTGLAFGGNKTRKLEYLLADAKNKSARTLITTGSIQSNHCRQTAAAAARVGMDCILVLTGEEPEQPVGNTFLDLLLGAELVWTAQELRDATLKSVFQAAVDAGREPYLVPYGASNPIGAAAYVYAMREFLEQNIEADWIVFASSSGGTQAGLVVGAYLYGFQGQVLGISVDEPAADLRVKVAKLATETSQYLENAINYAENDIDVNADYLGGGYAVMGEVEREAIQLFARHEGLLVDPVYTGRAAAGMIDLIRKGFFSKDDTVLFWHTGGTPALFAEGYRGELLQEG
ncbi:MAG: D-cysteine desulfhydrase family protein [Chloroflexi bacterium]|nr:D-cysteine desulfhydrase family protein [Chloroflexota bacterium]